ncbi:MAG: anaerobic ribonucleoside-triphosphate reductase-activating protein, partial [Aeromonas sp.]
MPLFCERARKSVMHYHQYYPVDVINGPGTRAT